MSVPHEPGLIKLLWKKKERKKLSESEKKKIMKENFSRFKVAINKFSQIILSSLVVWKL